jgi:hypothetical protein
VPELALEATLVSINPKAGSLTVSWRVLTFMGYLTGDELEYPAVNIYFDEYASVLRLADNL